MDATSRANTTGGPQERGARVVVNINGRDAFGTAGETILEVADRAGGLLDSQCLAGACGTCMVRVVEGAENLVPPGGVEEILLDPKDLVRNIRLSCQARLRGNVRVVSAPESVNQS